MRRRIAVRFVVFTVAAVAAATVATSVTLDDASAHQSGCHRWHTCPSDTGSYTCGDLGYPCTTGTSPTPAPAPTPAPTTPYSDKNCADFASQQAAQDFYNAHPGDPSHLDGDNDTIACQLNPCPCSPGAGPQPTTPVTTPGIGSEGPTVDPDCTAAVRKVARLKRLVGQARARVARASGRSARRRAARRLAKLRDDLSTARENVDIYC
jgi:hypothetical protein